MPLPTQQGPPLRLIQKHVGASQGEFMLLDWEREVLESSLPGGVSFLPIDDLNALCKASVGLESEDPVVQQLGLTRSTCKAAPKKAQSKAKDAAKLPLAENRTKNKQAKDCGQADKQSKATSRTKWKAQSLVDSAAETVKTRSGQALATKNEMDQPIAVAGSISGPGTCDQKEKDRLQAKVDQLSDSQLDHVLDFLTVGNPPGGAVIQQQECAYELDIDKLAPEQRHELVHLVDTLLQQGTTGTQVAATRQPETPLFPTADPAATPVATPRSADTMLHDAKEVLRMVDFGW